MKIKIGREEFDITEEDIVLFNGALWQLLTQNISKGWNHYVPVIEKTKAEKWKRAGAIYLVKETGLYKTKDGRQMGAWYYKFNIEKLKEIEK